MPYIFYHFIDISFLAICTQNAPPRLKKFIVYLATCHTQPNQIKPPVRLAKHNRALVRHYGFWIFLLWIPFMFFSP
jgi:hypothetical protein